MSQVLNGSRRNAVRNVGEPSAAASAAPLIAANDRLVWPADWHFLPPLIAGGHERVADNDVDPAAETGPPNLWPLASVTCAADEPIFAIETAAARRGNLLVTHCLRVPPAGLGLTRWMDRDEDEEVMMKTAIVESLKSFGGAAGLEEFFLFEKKMNGRRRRR